MDVSILSQKICCHEQIWNLWCLIIIFDAAAVQATQALLYESLSDKNYRSGTAILVGDKKLFSSSSDQPHNDYVSFLKTFLDREAIAFHKP